MIKFTSKFSQPPIFLIEKCKVGNTSAFRELVKTTQSFAYNFALKTINNQDDAKDVVQETYIKVWKNINKYNSNSLFTTWLYKILVNTCLDKLKSKKSREKLEIWPDEEFKNEEKNISNKDLVRHIKKLSRQLPYKQRIIFILKDLQDLSIDEVGQIMNMKKALVKSNLYYARKNLRDKILKLEEREITNEVREF